MVHVGEQWAPEDYEIPRHEHPVWEFYLQLAGWSLWQDDSRTDFQCERGDFFAPPPNRAHWLHATSHGRHHFLYAAIDVNAMLSTQLAGLSEAWRPRPIKFRAGHGVESAFRKLVTETTGERPFREHGLRAALDSLVLEVSRRLVTSSESPSQPAQISAVDVVRHALETHPAEPWKLTDLGRLAGMSPNHLVSLFTAEQGMGPHRYLVQCRIERAKEWLRDPERTVTGIAHELGFHSSQHFARVFRRVTGQTATEFRSGVVDT